MATGLFRVIGSAGSESWQYYCDRCKTHTNGSQPLQAGMQVDVWCCGQVKTFALTFWNLFRMKKVRMPRPNPVQLVPMGVDAMKEFGSYEYEQSTF